MITEKTNYELLAALVSSNKKVEAIMNHYAHNFYLITRVTYEDLRNLGLTPQEAMRLVAALELFKRSYTTTNIKKIENSNDAYSIFKDLSFSKVEIFAVIFMDRACNIITHQKMFIGGISEAAVDVRIIFNRAIALSAVNLIGCHNHPSGYLQPSTADTTLCNQIKSAGKILQISLLDFLIIGNNQYISFQDTGIF